LRVYRILTSFGQVGRTEPDESRDGIEFLEGKQTPQMIKASESRRDISIDPETLTPSIARKKITVPESGSFKEARTRQKRTAVPKELFVIENRLTKEDFEMDSFRDSAGQSTKDTAIINHNLSHEISMSVRKKEISEEQFNQGNTIVKGVMDAVHRVMAEMDSTGSLHKKPVLTKNHSRKDSPDINVIQERSSNLIQEKPKQPTTYNRRKHPSALVGNEVKFR